MGVLVNALSSGLSLAAFLGAAIPFVIFVNLLYRFASDARLPPSLPWAGIHGASGPWSRIRANLTSLFHTKSLLNEGYAKYSKNDKTYVLPHFLTGPEVVLPPSQARWLVEQPDSLLSQTEVNRQFLEADHTFLHSNIVREPVHPELIKRELTHKLSSFADDIVEELHQCLEENWGTDTEEWHEVKVYDTLLDVIARLSVRVFVGKPLCQDRDFLHSARMFDKNVVLSAAALNIMPRFLKPLLSPILTIYDYLQYIKLSKFVQPVINDRLGQLGPEGKDMDGRGQQKPGHNDYFQWAIDHALAHWDRLELTPKLLTCRLACLCFAAIQSSVISITNTLFDIASSSDCDKYLTAIREEVLAEVPSVSADLCSEYKEVPLGTEHRGSMAPSPWGKATLARLTHVDSALRESMRLNGFVARGIMKLVTAREGVVLPDGSRIPYGTKVGIQAYNVHRDDSYYSDPDSFKAFRFVDAKISENDSATDMAVAESSRLTEGVIYEQKSKAAETREPKALVSTSPTFLAFSHGPNACPGRFFAANQLKLTLAHIALLYEIEPIKERPVNKWFVGSMAPPMHETLRVRRRKVKA